MFAEKVTVFNRLGQVWYPAELAGVHVQADRGGGTAPIGARREDTLTVLVPYEPGEEAPKTGGRLYLPPRTWRAAADPERYVTFDPGPGGTVILLGPWEEGAVEEDRWPEGFYGRMNRDRDGVFALTAVCRYEALPHFELTGR